MISVKQICKDFSLSRQQRRELQTTDKSLRAVHEVSFDCQPGRVLSLLGPNGAGKTTTLRMIATILKPNEGSIKVAGYDVATHEKEVRRNIGFLTGSTRLYHRLTPNELVKYFADLYDLDKDTFTQRKTALFSLLDMHDFANKRIGQLSTGMKQKVSIARSMIHDPQVLIFDEPTSGLDVITAASIIDLIRRCKIQQKTVIFSSHIMSEVDLLCDDLVLINRGKLCYSGTMDTFRKDMQSANLTEEFIRLIGQEG